MLTGSCAIAVFVLHLRFEDKIITHDFPKSPTL
jgi:hypothetical protein